MTDAPETIWAKEGHDSWGQYGDWYRDNKGGGTEYTRSDVSQARIAQLEAVLQDIASIGLGWTVQAARDDLKAKP
jgi:hypothetical protein